MRIVIILVVAVVASSCGTDDRLARDRIRAQVEAARTPEYATRNKEARGLWTKTRDFYRARAFAPVWLEQRRATAKMEALVAAIKRAGRDGLDPVSTTLRSSTNAAARDGSASARKMPARSRSV